MEAFVSVFTGRPRGYDIKSTLPSRCNSVRSAPSLYAKKQRRCTSFSLTMNEAQNQGSANNENVNDNVTNVQKKEDAKLQNEEEDKLQKNQYYVFREFGKISAVAVLIGLVLFFYDIIVSLMAMTVGLIYGLAVLFEVKGADTLISNTVKSSRALFSGIGKGCREGWRTLRREVRKGLED